MMTVILTPCKARIYLDITSPTLQKIPFAVPYFINMSKQGPPVEEGGKEMADILSRALEFHGFVTVIDPLLYKGNQSNEWESHGADFAIFGQYLHTDADEVTMELRLIEAGTGRMLMGRRYRGEWDKRKYMALRYCDEIIRELTGERGVSLTKIAYISDKSGHDEVYISDILGDEIRQVTMHRSITVSPRYSPDGLKLAYTSYHKSNPNLYITDLRQSKYTVPISRRKGLNIAAAWAPDGEKLAITLSEDGNPDLYVIDTEGVILNKLTDHEGINVSPSWSPDGKKIAFVSDRSGSPQIYVMDLETEKVQRITYVGSYNTTPAWSPKGDLIAYSGFFESMYHIYTISPEGGRPTRVTHYWGDHESPSWSPDGRQIVFSRKRNNKQKLYAILKNGSALREIISDEGELAYPRWSPRSK